MCTIRRDTAPQRETGVIGCGPDAAINGDDCVYEGHREAGPFVPDTRCFAACVALRATPPICRTELEPVMRWSGHH